MFRGIEVLARRSGSRRSAWPETRSRSGTRRGARSRGADDPCPPIGRRPPTVASSSSSPCSTGRAPPLARARATYLESRPRIGSTEHSTPPFSSRYRPELSRRASTKHAGEPEFLRSTSVSTPLPKTPLPEGGREALLKREGRRWGTGQNRHTRTLATRRLLRQRRGAHGLEFELSVRDGLGRALDDEH